jgi:hypothetical protein
MEERMSIAVSLRKSSMVFLIAGSFLGGAIAGGGFNELRHRSAQATDRALFSAKLRCQRIGQKYSTDNSTDGGPIGLSTVTVLKVDYSPASHSCIAETWVRATGLNSVTYQIRDIVTNELYGGEICGDSNDCDKRSGEINDRVNALFARAVAGKAQPIGR